MNDKMDLRQWLAIHDDQDEMKVLFHRMDSKMKYIHGKGFYIMNFEPSKINVDQADIYFEELGSMTNDNYEILINHNIYTMSLLHIAGYSKCIDFLKSSFLFEHFDEFAPFLPKDDVTYYRSVILDKKYYYLKDYTKILEETRNKDLSTEGNGKTSTNQRTYTKATPAGRLYQEQKESVNNAAFVNAIELTVIIVTTILITLLGVIISIT